ncbi:MAG: FliG C-terminal domain-containing protein [Planctomycetota bacterium]
MIAQTEPSIREAAAFFRSLPPEAAATMLSRLSAEEASRLRTAMRSVARSVAEDEPPTDASRAEESLTRQGNARSRPTANVSAEPDVPDVAESNQAGGVEADGVELVLSDLASQTAAASPRAPVVPSVPATPIDDDPWLHSLSEAEPETIAGFLEGEQPAAIALVLSHLPSDVSAAVLACFDEERRAAVLLQLSRSGDADPAAVRVIATELSNWIQTHRHEEKRRAERITMVQSILDAMPGGERRQLVDRLGEADNELGVSLGARHPLGASESEGEDDATPAIVKAHEESARPTPPSPPLEPREIVVARLARVDAKRLLAAARTLPARTAILALVELPPRQLNALTKQLTGKASRDLLRRLDAVAPVRLNDVETAQRTLDAAVRRTFFTNGHPSKAR